MAPRSRREQDRWNRFDPFFPHREEPQVNTLSATPVDHGLLITAGGYEDLRAELETLRGHIGPELSERLRDARQDGHLADNPRLFDLLEEQARLDHRIALLEAQLAAAQIAVPATDGRAGIGSRVRVRDLEVLSVLPANAQRLARKAA
jgi:hypothetical protein